MVQCIRRFYQSMIRWLYRPCSQLVSDIHRQNDDHSKQNQKKFFLQLPDTSVRHQKFNDGWFCANSRKTTELWFGTKCTYAKESHQKANHALRIRRQSQKITTSSRCSSINRLLDGRTLRCCGHSFTSQKSRFISTIGTVAAATCKSLPVTSNQWPTRFFLPTTTYVSNDALNKTSIPF